MVRKSEIPDHLVDTALALAAERGWRGMTLADLAAAAKVPLAEVYRHYGSRGAILDAFMRRIDLAMLGGAEPSADEPVRDRLFDLLMRRFDALAPHREAMRVLLREVPREPGTALVAACGLRRGMAWALEAAGVGASGLAGALRVKALGAAYLGTMRIWLDDDSEDLGRTMAALDKRLRRLERLAGFMPVRRRRRRPDDSPEGEAEAPA